MGVANGWSASHGGYRDKDGRGLDMDSSIVLVQIEKMAREEGVWFKTRDFYMYD